MRLETKRPRRMTVRPGSSEGPPVEALVVTLNDGRLGFSTTLATAERAVARAPLTLTGSGTTVTGVPEVVRSGTAYEEVRGRTRRAEGRLARWRRRRDDAVVLVRLADLS